MTVKPMLGSWTVPRIESIETSERRSLVELAVPGRVGSLFQDLNSGPTRIAIRGSLFGEEDRDTFLEEIRGKYREGEPVTFVADIVSQTDVQYVVIDELHFEESAARPDELSYSILLRESPPPPPPDTFGGLDTSLLDDAAGFLDSVTGALDMIDGLGSIPDIGNPIEPLGSALDSVTAATSGLDEALGVLKGILERPEDTPGG